MSVVNISDAPPPHVYVILGIDEHEHDQVLAVRATFSEATRFCIELQVTTQFYDIWIEKHPLM